MSKGWAKVISFSTLDKNTRLYLNELFAGNTGSKMQPNYNSKYGCKCIRYQGPSLWNRVDNKFKLESLHFSVNEWSLHGVYICS